MSDLTLTAEENDRLRRAACKRTPVGDCLCRTCSCGRCEMHRLCPHSPLYHEQALIACEIYARTGTWVDLSGYTPPKVTE